MKLIIIIQSLIIIAGAYYVYSLGQPVEEVVVPAPVDVPVVDPGVPREGYAPPTENPPADPATLNSEVTGHSDVGMEFPIPDEEIQVR
jgi:hypothetical protein